MSDPDRDNDADWWIVPLSPVEALIGLSIIVMRAYSLEFVGALFSSSDFPTYVLGRTSDSGADPIQAGTIAGQSSCESVRPLRLFWRV